MFDDLEDYQSNGITLKLGCGACPEQYDAVDEDGYQLGYLRLRHGRFTVECPDVGGDLVLKGYPTGYGQFTTEERARWLDEAIAKIKEWMVAHGKA